MRVCSDTSGHLVLAIKRTNRRTTAILYKRGKRCIRIIPNREFDIDYKLTNITPEVLVNKWLTSNIKMTQEVKKELEMFVQVKGGKIVAKTDEKPEVADDKIKVYAGVDDVAALKPAGITTLNKAAGGEALTSTDKAENAQMTWDNMVKFEIPTKVEKAPKEKKEKVAVVKTYTFVTKAEKLPKQAQIILDLIEAAGTISRVDLLAAMVGKVETVQTLERILGFYEPRLISAYVSVSK